jgi:exopolysaccharide biosynthesis polyprenyl glycosylphosphotransferase
MRIRRFGRPRKSREPAGDAEAVRGGRTTTIELDESGGNRAAHSFPAPETAERHPLDYLLRAEEGAEEEIHEAGEASRSARHRDAIYRRMLAAADIAAAAIAVLLAVVVLGGDRVRLWFLLAIPLVVLVGKVVGLYDRDEHLIRKTTLEEAPALFQVSTLYTLLLWLGEGAFVQEGLGTATDNLGRSQVLGLWGLLFVGMLACRTLARQLAGGLAPPERCLVLGNSNAAETLAGKFRSSRSLSTAVVGRVPFESTGDANGGPPVLGTMDELAAVLTRHQIERVIIAPSTADPEQLLDAIRLAKSLGVKVSVLPRLFEVVGSSVKFDDVEGLMLLGVPRYGLSQSSRLLKRAMDVTGAACALAAFAPVFVVIALAVKLSSPGPVFFRQTRIGRDGKPFEMLKFRTMIEDADQRKADLLEMNEAQGLFKIANDPRTTRVGRITRRFSLDELPQLINVLRGEMSLVGPRPLVIEDDRQIQGWQRRRLEITPGMTGIWQVLGSSSRIPLHEMVKIDYLYGANWSPWLDMTILLRTVPHVLGRRGL